MDTGIYILKKAYIFQRGSISVSSQWLVNLREERECMPDMQKERKLWV